MNKHNITAANYQKEFVMLLAKSGSNILSSLVPDIMNPEFDWDQKFLASASEKLHILHMAIGVAGEGVEFYLVCGGYGDEDSTIIEELGDTLFYSAGLAEVFNLDFCHIIQNSLREGNAVEFLYNTSQVLEQTKKYFIYSDDSRKEKVEETLYKVASNILDVMAYENITLQGVIDHNVEKLDERYEGLKYSDKAAQVRADKKEDAETAKRAQQAEQVFGEDSVLSDIRNNPPVAAPGHNNPVETFNTEYQTAPTSESSVSSSSSSASCDSGSSSSSSCDSSSF